MTLNELTVNSALEKLKHGDITSQAIVQDCLSAIERSDPEIKAFVTVTGKEALQSAEEADKEIKQKGLQAFEAKPLLGMPYACKDNFCTKGVKTTASSKVLEDFVPPYESAVTQRLKDAGAILLGKTNMDAWAHGSSTETSDFFTTKNPWDVTRVPGGSSGGSAAAVASHMCLFAIGSETGGSIRCPASWCGVTGLKPTYGRVSRYGLIAMASSTDSPGPITKNVEDAALILQTIAGNDLHDATTSPVPVENYLANTANVSLKGLKIGRPKSYFEMDLAPGVREAVEKSLSVLRDLGADIIDLDLIDPKYSIAVYTILQRSEVSSNLARYDGIRFGNDRSSFGFEAKKRMMLGAYALSAGYYDQYYSKAQKVRTLLIDDFEKAFEKVDVILGPTMHVTAVKIGESEGDSMFGEMMDVLNLPAAIAGITGITVNCGFSDGLPVGLQFLGPMFAESTVLGVAKSFQSATDFIKFPKGV
ncbi:MAG: Asp-tRNA(Asn)/Glu-tRNA(Gln) amidotransferase subunit GatA [Patescibacteria group bacterium]|jgi:aspartyl-tRNA(Asn)/glutamyl-tRNA(Gln) amidotransferase subunit A